MDLQDNPFVVAIDPENDKLYAADIASGTVVAVDLQQEEISLGLGESAELDQITGTGGGCLIATAAYGSELAYQVQLLREVRDNTLLSTTSGITFIAGFNQIYYSFSPTIADWERQSPVFKVRTSHKMRLISRIADWERQSPVFKEAVKLFITPMISTLSIMTLAEQGSEEQVVGLGISLIAFNLGM